MLGSTGSIGDSTLDVVARHPDRFAVYALTAHRNGDKLFAQCLRFQPDVRGRRRRRHGRAGRRRAACARGCRTEVLHGAAGARRRGSTRDSCDTVMAAIVGAAGLAPTLAAARAGKRLLLANKEALVMSRRSSSCDAVRDNGAALLPIDSEHNAIFQCLPR